MNSLPPLWTTALFNTAAFTGGNYLTKQQADLLYLGIAAGKNLYLIDGLVPGIVTASRAVVVDASSNISGFNSLSATSLTGTLQTAAQPNITSVGNLSSLSMFGDIVMSGHNITNVNSLSATSLTGTLQTAAQPNITSLGTLTSLTLSGAINLNSSTANFSALNFTNTNTGARNTIAFNGDVYNWELGTRNSTASSPNSLYIYNSTGSYKLLMDKDGNISLSSTSNSTSSTTGALVTAGGLGVGLNAYIDGNTILCNNQMRIVQSSSVCYIQTGASISSGSSQDLFFGNMLNTISTSSRKFMIKASGNIGIQTYSPNSSLSVNNEIRLVNTSDGSDPEYSLLTQQASGGLILKLNGSLYQGLYIQQSSATTNLQTATGIDLGTAYQSKALAITSTNGGISGSEAYLLGTNNTQTLNFHSFKNFKWYTGTTPSSLGTVKMTLNVNGALAMGTSNAPSVCCDVAGGSLRVQGNAPPGAGSSLEISYSSSVSNIYSYDRSGSSYLALNLNDTAYLTSDRKFLVGPGVTSKVGNAPFQVLSSNAYTQAGSYGYLSNLGAGQASSLSNRQFSAYFSSGLLVNSSEIDSFSDIRMKQDISSIDEYDDLYLKVLDITPIRFKYKTQHENDNQYFLSWSAQDLLKIGLTDVIGITEITQEIDLEEEDIECDNGDIYHLDDKHKLVLNMMHMIPIAFRLIKILKDRNSALRDAMLAVEDSNSVLRTAMKVIINLLPAKKKESAFKFDIIKTIIDEY
jgi:hypothetical protein